MTRTAKAAYQYPASGGCIELPGYPGGGLEWGSVAQAYAACTASLKLFYSEVAILEGLLGIPAEETYTRHEARAAWYPTSYAHESRIARSHRVLQRGLRGLPVGTYEARIGAITYAGNIPWVHRCKLLCDLIPSIDYVGEYARSDSTLLGLQGFRVMDGLVSPVIGVLTTSHQVSPQHIHDVLPEAVYPATAENGDCQRCSDAECPTRGARTACHFHTSLPAYYLLTIRRAHNRRSLQVLAHEYLRTRSLGDCTGKRA